MERDFSRLNLLWSKLRRSMKPETVERKMWLMLNTQYWEPNPELEHDASWLRIKKLAKLPALAEHGEDSNSEQEEESGDDSD